MGPIVPPESLPVAVEIAGGLSPERTIFIDGGVRCNAKWFDVTLQCGPSLREEDDIGFRVIINFHKDYAGFTANSCLGGVWDDLLARNKELAIKGLIKKEEIVESKNLYNLSNLSNLLRCALRPQTDTDSLHSFTRNIETDIEKENLFQKTSVTPVNSVRLIDLNQNVEGSLNTASKNVKTLRIISPDEEKLGQQKLTKKSDEESSENDVHKSDALTGSNQNEENKAAALKQIRSDVKQEQVNESTEKDASNSINSEHRTTNEQPTQNVPLKSSEIRAILPENPFKPVASVYMNPDLNEGIDEIDLVENLGHTNLLNKINIPDALPLDKEETFSESELNEIDLHPGEPFSMALECLEGGFMVFLNGDLFCAYPHHFSYDRVTYIVFNGDIDLELVEVGGGKRPDRTLIVDLYNEIIWSDQVFILTDDNFTDLVLRSKKMWIIDAYTAWCPACEQLKPIWQTVAIELMGKINVGACDCERNEQLTDDLNVDYYPMVICYMEGKKDIKSYRKYRGGYIAQQIVSWALNLLEHGRSSNAAGYLNFKDQKSGPQTLRKPKKPVRERRGYLVSGYGYILRKENERPEHHETSSTKFIYASTQTTEIEAESGLAHEEEPTTCSCNLL